MPKLIIQYASNAQLRPSAFNKRRLRSLPQQLQRSSSKGNNLPFTIVRIFIVGFDVLVGDCLDHLDDVLRLGDKTN